MNPSKRYVKLIALILILAGGALFLFLLSRVAGFDFIKPGNADMREVELRPEEPFSSISALLRDCDLSLWPSADGRTSVKIRCSEDAPVTAAVEDGILKLSSGETKKRLWNLFSFNRESPAVTLFLPPELSPSITAVLTSGNVESTVTNAFGQVNIQTVSGDIAWNGDSQGTQFDFTTTSGDVSVSRAEALRLNIQTTSGDIDLRECGCAPDGGITVDTTSGEILLKSSSAQAVSVRSTSGDITLESVECGDAAIIRNTSGEVRLADLVTAGICQIGTTSGDVHLVRADAGKFDIDTVSGDVTGSITGIEKEVRTDGSAAEENWTVKTTTGFVHIFPASGE